ncbi:MAG: transposase [Rhodospirillaceae bacterium]
MASATKPELAREMIGMVLDARVPCAWVLGDAVYGLASWLRRMMEDRRQPYALAVPLNRFVTYEGLA